MRSFLYFILLLLPATLWAQTGDKTPDFETGYIGFTVSQPFLKQGLESPSPWTGIAAKLGPVTAGFDRGYLYPEGQAETYGWKTGWMVHAAYTRNFARYYNPEKLSVGTVKFIPFWEIGAAMVRAGIDGEETRSLSLGLKTSLGLTIRMPFVFIDLKPNGYLLAKEGMFRSSNEVNGFSGLAFAPSITVGIDGLYDILSPSFKRQQFQTIEDRQRTEKTGETTRTDYDYSVSSRTMTRTTTTTSHYETTYWKEVVDNDFQFYNIKPYFTAGARVTVWPENLQRGHTLLYGPQIGMRFGMFGFDAYYVQGENGINTGINQALLQDYGVTDPNFTLRATQGVRGIGGTFSIDMAKTGISEEARRKLEDNVFTYYTNYFRMMLRINYQYTWLDGALEYSEETAGEYLEDYLQSSPRDAEDININPGTLPETLQGGGVGIGFEMGIAAISYDHTWYKGAPLMGRSSVTLSANVPWTKVAKGFSSRFAYRKARRQELRRMREQEKNAPAEN